MWEALADADPAGGEESVAWGLVLMMPLHSKLFTFTWTVWELLSGFGVTLVLLVAENMNTFPAQVSLPLAVQE